ncbi:hypothetical protein [Paenibacillus crassostreae]|nr:hypothetical protein [Paenibacillus crassostreae]
MIIAQGHGNIVAEALDFPNSLKVVIMRLSEGGIYLASMVIAIRKL